MSSRPVGALLLVAGFVLLLCSPDEFSVLHLFGFLFCVVFGLMLVTGLLGRNARLRQQITTAATTAPPRPPIAITQLREFRYPRPRLGTKLLFTLLTLLFCGLAVFAAVVGKDETRLVGFALFAPAVLLWLYYRAHYRQIVTIDATGIRSRGYFRTASMRWNEVLALQAFSVHTANGVDAGTVLRLHALDRTIQYFGSLVQAEELTQLVANATGRDWAS